MLTLYFSGTGNSKYVAERFSRIMAADCHSIEDEIDFAAAINSHDTLCFCYPTHASCIPIIMEDFIQHHKPHINKKNLIILCTQHTFSGDGARVFTNLLRNIKYNVLYAEHIFMPNNVSNLFFYKIDSQKKIMRYFKAADTTIQDICDSINKGIIHKRGFNFLSRFLGFITQRWYFSLIRHYVKKRVKIYTHCNCCSLCVRNCPTKNLEIIDAKVKSKESCTLCYRCVNICPHKAITVIFYTKIRRQYSGITINESDTDKS